MDIREIKEINSIRRVLEVEMVEGYAPDPSEVLQAAEAAIPKPRYLSASDYAPAVAALRAKGFTWAEVTTWLNQHNVAFSQQSFLAAHRRYQDHLEALEQSHISPNLRERMT